MPETPAWLWLNLLSLDAPIVALLWQDLAARAFGNPLRLAARMVLGLTVWAVYLADRLLDVRDPNPAPATARHRFYRRHPHALTVLLATVLALDAFVALVDLRREILLHGIAVAACVAAYLLTFPRRRSGWEKQVVAAILFSAGVLLVSATWRPLSTLWIPGAFFAALCLCNLVAIELLERDLRRRWLWLAPAALAALSLARPAGPWQSAVALSAVLLAAVALSAPRLTPDALRVLADAALLTPLLFR
jgi:hypothetical protein